jgi:hypothetical protein
MNSFYQIIQKLINLNSVSLSTENHFHTILLFYFSFKENVVNLTKKYDFLKRMNENIFLSENTKKEMVNIFSKSQQIYFAFSKLAFYYKWKRSKIVIDTDLGLNPINIGQNNTICLFHQGSRYFFIISDLVNLITNSLTYSSDFFSLPIPVKNPYNNIPFTKSNLYHIYFTLFFRCIPIPEIIQCFFQENMDLDSFEKENEALIREYIIWSNVENMEYSVLEVKIRYMLECYNKQHFKKIEVHQDFSKEKLIEVFKPYLHLFYLSIFSLDLYKKRKAKDLLEKLLFRLRYHFPVFGRKIIQITSPHSSTSHLSKKDSLEYQNISRKRKRNQKKRSINEERKKRIHLIRKNKTQGSNETTTSMNYSFDFLETLSKKEEPSYSHSFLTNLTTSSNVYFNEEYPPFFNNKKNEYFLCSHLGLLKTKPIEELLENEKYIISYRDLEHDRIPTIKSRRNPQDQRRNQPSREQENESSEDADDEEVDELIDVYVLQMA